MRAHTVEVVATFGDGVVAVRHVTAGRRSLLTTALIAIGAAALLIALAGFLWATHTASVNDTARDRWLDRGHPPWAFRPRTLPADLDVIFLGSAFLGLAALTAGLARRRPRGPDDGIRLSRDGPALELPTGDVVPVSEHTRLRVVAGSVVFHVATVGAPPALDHDLAGDRRALAFIAGSALAHVVLLLLLRTPLPPPTAQVDPVVVPPARAETEAEAAAESGGGSGGGSGSGSASMQLAERSSRRIQRASHPHSPGILSSGVIAAITGSADLAAGLDASDPLDADLSTIGGFGTRLSGFQDRVPAGSIPIERYSMILETPVPYPAGPRCGCIGPSRHHEPSARLGDPQGCVGDCDKALLRRHLRRSISKLSYCYEKQLLLRPGLRGTVVARFVLAPGGAVHDVTADGLDADLAACVRDVVAAVELPRFQTVLSITYPIHFRPSRN